MNLGFIIQIEFFDHDIAYEIVLSLFDHQKDVYIKNFYADDAEFWGIRSYSMTEFSLENAFDTGYDLYIKTIEELKAHLAIYLKQWIREQESSRQ
ncbi:hypothetical protein SU48_11525 [Deinococcus puniceus]|uniref:Uncharacterized protein n=2 Tax=Deinococcus puniceus TaxID=1182568 RepID=A0A172TBD6_9DEIO|nr:hypothetical protein SU48_11525 [Deinococcus puniceus]